MSKEVSLKTLAVPSALLAMLILSAAQTVAGDFKKEESRIFTGRSLQEISFPIGGIGTGCVSLGGRGDLRDWEIFNRPDKGSQLELTFFSVWAKQRGKKEVAKILERKIMAPYRGGGHGVAQRALSGLPRLDEAEFRGEYPFAQIKFKDAELPVETSLQAWNPFIPLNVYESAIPVAIFEWTLKNPTSDTVTVSIAASLFNPIGDRYTSVRNEKPGLGQNLNKYLDDGSLRGLVYSSGKVKEGDPNWGTMALVTTWNNLDVQTRWYRGGWWDRCHIFWDDFAQDGRVKNLRDTLASEDGSSDVGSIVLFADLAPGETRVFPFYITWYFPNRENYWNSEPSVRGRIMKNYVAGRFKDAWDVGSYVAANSARLKEDTRLFHDALFSSTMPAYVIDAASSQMSTLKTNVCILLEDSSFFGFEGSSDKGGCCPLNCSHVWNYEQTLAFLFPQLERSMRETDFLHNTLPNGYMTFRTLIPLGEEWWKFKACADGQMGTVMKAYREWKMSGDTKWLVRVWKNVKAALEFAWLGSGDPAPVGFRWTKEQVTMPWDPNKDGVMEGEQHNTYDIEFYGPNTMTGSLYLGALKAAARMADAVGEPEKAREYQTLYEKGSKKYDELLWASDYYIQKISVLKGLEVPKELVAPSDACCENKKKTTDTSCASPKYQYGEGCLSDQLLGQYFAHVAGLGYVLPEEHVKKGIKSVYDYNFKKSLADFNNVQRVYALNDESGLLLCSWPKGNRPALPFVYSDEVWTGIEYQVAATLIYNGWVEEGLTVVKGIRDRYNGERRNPWDEEECGHHYARAMASWAVITALSGFEYDGPAGSIGFSPRISADDFSSFWSSGTAWGVFTQKAGESGNYAKIEIKYGGQKIRSLLLHNLRNVSKKPAFRINGAPVKASVSGKGGEVIIKFDREVNLGRNDVLEISL